MSARAQQQIINNSTIGIVSILMGIAVVDGPEGLTRFLHVGDELRNGDIVRIPGEGSVEITLLDGSRRQVSAGESLALDFDDSALASSEVPGIAEYSVLNVRDVLEEDAANDLRAWLDPDNGSATHPMAANGGEFPLNWHSEDLPGWYYGLGGVLAGLDAQAVAAVPDDEGAAHAAWIS